MTDINALPDIQGAHLQESPVHTDEAPQPTSQFEERRSVPKATSPHDELIQNAHRLVLWEEPPKSAAALVASMGALIFSQYYSFFNTVCATVVLAIFINLVYVVGRRKVLALISQESPHPHAQYIENPIQIKRDHIDHYMDYVLDGANYVIDEAHKVLLIQDPMRSAKHLMIFYAAWTVGSWLSFPTMIGLTIVLAFAVPRLYKDNQKFVDEHLAQGQALARSYTDRGVALLKHHTKDAFAKGKHFAAQKVGVDSGKAAEKKEE